MRSRLVSTIVLAAVLAGCGAGAPDEEGPVESTEEPVVYCPGPATLTGVDVSVYQGNIDWNAVKASGIAFAIARVSDGFYQDTKFDQNWAGMKAVGLVRGVYQFFEPGEDPSAQADIVLQHIGQLGVGDLPPVLDVEVTGGQSPATINAHIHTWVDKIQAATGRVPIIYTGKYFWNDNVGTGDFSGLPLWLAAYVSPCPDTPNAWGSWRIWQYADNGSIPGIPAAVDMDKFDGDVNALMALASPPNEPPQGWLDGADCSLIHGWAQDPDAPDQPIAVHVYFNAGPGEPGAIAIPVTADQHRDDLCQAIGSCNHGYSLATPLSLLDGAPHDVRAFGIDTQGGFNPMLSGSPITLNCPPPAPPVDPASGIERWITSPAALGAWQLDTFRSLVHYPDDVMAQFPKGPNFPDAPTVVIADDGTPEVWVIDTNVRRHVIDPDSFAAWHFDAAGLLQTWPAAKVYAYPQGADFRPTPFMIQGSDPAVYMLDVPFQPGTLGEPPPTGAGGGGGASVASGAGGAGGGFGDSAFGGSADESGGCAMGGPAGGDSAAWLALALGLALSARRRARRAKS